MKLRLAGTVNRLNVEHRTSNIEHPILMTLRLIDFKTSEPQALVPRVARFFLNWPFDPVINSDVANLPIASSDDSHRREQIMSVAGSMASLLRVFTSFDTKKLSKIEKSSRFFFRSPV